MGTVVYPEFMAVMELMTTSLSEVIVQQQSLSLFNKLQMGKDAALGMCWIHRINIVHGDLNPHNILLDDLFTVKITDFGFHQFKQDLPGDDDPIGRWNWCAPEVINGEDPTKKSDIYSFGLCMVCCVFSF